MSMWRKNKYGEKIDVEKYCCGSCGHYDFEREDEHNYCDRFHRYFPMDDSCKGHWEESDECGGGGWFW